MTTHYRISLFMTAVDKELAVQLREALGRVIKGAGKETLRELMRRAHSGERVLVYQTNDDKNALQVAESLKGAGAQIEVEGLQGPEEPF